MIAKLHTKEEFADILGKPVSHVEELCRKRQIDFTFVGREYRFTDAQMAAYIASCAKEAVEPDEAVQAETSQPTTRKSRKRSPEPTHTTVVGAPVFEAQPWRGRRQIPASVGGVA